MKRLDWDALSPKIDLPAPVPPALVLLPLPSLSLPGPDAVLVERKCVGLALATDAISKLI